MLVPDLMAQIKWWGKHPPMAYAGGGTDRGGPDQEVLDDDGLVALLGGGA
jgi:hypothetical protein